MVAAGVARKLVFSWLGNPGVGGLGAIRRRIEGAIPDRAARGRGVQPLRDGRALHGGRHEPAVLPAAQLLRDRPAGRQPADPPDRLAVRRRDRLRGAAAPAGRHDRPRAAGVGRRRHPGLGPPRLPEGGRLRGRPGDRRGRGAGRRGGHPRRPEPDDHPGAHRRRGRRRAVGRPPVVRPGRLRPRQPVLPRLGRDHPRRGGDPGLAARMGLRRSTAGRPTSRSSGRSASPSLEPGAGAVGLGRLRGRTADGHRRRYLVADVDRSSRRADDRRGRAISRWTWSPDRTGPARTGPGADRGQRARR